MKINDVDAAMGAIKDGATVAIGGAGAGHAVPDKLLKSLGEYFLKNNSPKNLTTVHPCGIGDADSRGLNHIAFEGLIKRDIGGFWGNAPKMCALAQEEKIEGYNFPQGVLAHLMRATAAGEKGLLTKVGVNTFVDPDVEGGKINSITKEDLVEKITINGEDQLYFKTYPIDVAFIRGSYADAEGNISMEEEVGTFSMLSLAQAAKVNGGIVIAQVKRVRKDHHAKPVQVKVPGVMIDYIIEDPDQTMTFITDQNEALVDRKASFESEDLSLKGVKKIISRRAAMELKKGGFINLGYGLPDGVPIVAEESGVKDEITFMIEQGPINGILTTGLNFGAMYNPSCIVDDGYQFDFFHGGGLDVCYLGFAQIDKLGNVNSSRFGEVITGCGGFIDISQNTKKVVFCGAFAAKADIEISDAGIQVNEPGKFKKFVDEVQQITFSGKLASQQEKEVYYVTERAVFQLVKEGVKLLEIAPGIDLEKDVLSMMEFTPIMDQVQTMPLDIFSNQPFNLKSILVS